GWTAPAGVCVVARPVPGRRRRMPWGVDSLPACSLLSRRRGARPGSGCPSADGRAGVGRRLLATGVRHRTGGGGRVRRGGAYGRSRLQNAYAKSGQRITKIGKNRRKVRKLCVIPYVRLLAHTLLQFLMGNWRIDKQIVATLCEF